MKDSCPQCGGFYDSGQETCKLCGIDLPLQKPPKRKTPEKTKKSINKNLTQCEDCGKSISKKVTACPYCGAPSKQGFNPVGCVTIIILLSIAFFFFAITPSDKKSEKAKRPQLTEAQKAQKKAEREEKKKEEYELCKTDLECWGNKHSLRATFASEELIEKQAKYQFEWTDGWMGTKMTRFRWKNKDKLTLTYFGDQIKFQNGFGAWQNMKYQCDYDPINEKVLGIRVFPGRL